MDGRLQTRQGDRIWSATDGSLNLEAPAALLEAIRQEASFAMNGPARGGVEVGGLLLGRRDGKWVSIHDWRPVRCDHSQGASFQLSTRDIAALSCQIEGVSMEGGLSGLSLVGWFVSRIRGEHGVRPADLSLRQRLFPEGAELFLTIRPNQFGDTEVSAYTLPANGGAAVAHPGALQLEPRPGLRWEPPSLRGPRQATPARDQARGIAPWSKAAALAALVLASAGLGWNLWRKAPVPVTEAAPATASKLVMEEPVDLPSLHVRQVGGRIEISWNARAKTVRTASGATLTVVDQGRSFTRAMTPEELQLGRIDYNIETKGVEVSLLVESKDGEAVLERASFHLSEPGAKLD